MKAIQELVAYFDRKGALSKAQIHKLLDQGFLAAEAPHNMLGLTDPVGASYYFRVRGEIEGPLWGTDTYTGDSILNVAAVHAGLVKPGEIAVIKVTVVPPLNSYQGSVRNGILSHDFARYGSAYTLSAV
jgi:hypothetical protein